MQELTLDEPRMWFIAGLAALLAGFVRGFAGFGGPAIMTLMLVPFYAPVSVLTKVILVDLFSGLKLLPSTAREVDRRLTGIIILASFAGAPIGIWLLVEVDPVLIRRSIGVVTALCALVMLAGVRFRTVPSLWLHAVVGFVAGVVFGGTFIALVMIVFLFATPAAAAVSRANTVWWAFTVTVAVLIGYVIAGILHWDGAWRALILGVVYLAAVIAGSRVFRRTSERDFRRVVLWLLVVLSGIALVGD